MSLPTDGYINEDSLGKINGGANNNTKNTTSQNSTILFCPKCRTNRKFNIFHGGVAVCSKCSYKTEA